MPDETPFFLSKNSGFGDVLPEDDLLHPARNALVKADSLTETQYFGFCIPEEHIHGYCYLWHHPNLHLVSGGLFAWRGHKRSVVHGELCDYRDFMSDSVLSGDLHEYRLPNGYGVKIVEPLKRHQVTYSDPRRKNSLDLTYDAVAAPVMFGDGNHFEQPMHVSGEVTLRGRVFKVDCFTVRDRSWGKARPEDNLAIPSVSWIQGVFNKDFAFNCTLLDQVRGNPELQGTSLALPDKDTVNGGWLLRDGKLGRIVSVTKRVVRLADSRIPRSLDIEFSDEHSRDLRVQGTSIASTTWLPWSNCFMPIVLMRWECDGLIAHGDVQEGVWNDYLNLPAF